MEESGSKAANLEFPFFDFNEVELPDINNATAGDFSNLSMLEEIGSKAANLEFPLFDFNEVELHDMNNGTAGNFLNGIVELGSLCESSPALINQLNSNHSPSASDQNNQLLEAPSESNGQNLAPSVGDPTLIEATQLQKTAENVEEELRTPAERDEQPQLDQMNANPDTFEHDNSNPLHEHVDLVSSPGGADESFLHHASSMQPTYSGFEGSDSSLGDATDSQQTSSPFSALIMEATQSFPLALAEMIPPNGSYEAKPFYSEHEVNSVKANQLDCQTGSGLQAELLGPQLVEPVNPGKTVLFADQFEQNNGNNNFNDNQLALPYPNFFPQSLNGMGFLNGGSMQINQQAPSWISNRENNLYSALAPSGSQFNQIKATYNSDPQCYNFMQARSSASLRPQHFSYQYNQVPTAPGPYNSQTCGTMLPESSIPLRTQIPPLPHRISPLDVSDLQHRNSLLPKTSMHSSGGFIFKDLSDPRHHEFNPAKLITDQFGAQSSNSMLQESLMLSGSHQLPPHQKASNQFPMIPSLLNSKLPGSSTLPWLQTLQQQHGLLNQTARPLATYPSSGPSLSSLVFNPLFQPETGGTSASPYQMETSLRSHNEQGIFGRRGHARSRFELGESSSSKRFRRQSTMPQAYSAERVNRTLLSLQNEATSSNIASLLYPRPIRNSVYDPKFEGIGLPIDPHLRLFATN